LDPLGHNSRVGPNLPFGGLAYGLVLGPLPSARAYRLRLEAKLPPLENPPKMVFNCPCTVCHALVPNDNFYGLHNQKAKINHNTLPKTKSGT